MFEPGEAYEKILIADLQRVIDFLKFAEAKNAALLALSSAWALAAINIELSDRTLPGIFDWVVPATLVLALCAAVLAAYSFFPRLKIPAFIGGKRAGPHAKNLLFFGDIASMTAKTLELELPCRYLPDSSEFRKEYLHDLIVQISVNSSITSRKMNLFAWGIGLVIAAALCLLAAALGMVLVAVKGAI